MSSDLTYNINGLASLLGVLCQLFLSEAPYEKDPFICDEWQLLKMSILNSKSYS